MDAMWSASTIKVIGSGIDDPDFADKLSRLIGDHDVETTSTSHSDSGMSTSVSMRQERILAADAIRALPKGTALCFAPDLRAAMLAWARRLGIGLAPGAAHRNATEVGMTLEWRPCSGIFPRSKPSSVPPPGRCSTRRPCR